MKEAEFLPYSRQTIEQDDIDAVVRVLKSDYLTTGPEIERFEAALADTVGATDAVVVSSGTAALHAACFAARVEEGDEVIVPAISFLATANCARYLNAEPIFADVDPDTGQISVADVERRCGPATRAIIPVHLNGAVADMEGLGAVAEAAGAIVIEDAAHALGARAGGEMVGSCGRDSKMAAFSFHPVKQIATGEGGAITTCDPDLARKLRLFRNHGIERDPARLEHSVPGSWYYEQHCLGYNLRMTSMQAALGTSQLGKLGRFLIRRRQLAARYDELLRGLEGVMPVVGEANRKDCAYHLYPVLIPFEELDVDRAEVMNRLLEAGLTTQVHYIPLPAQPYYRSRGWKPEDFPGAARYYERVLSLPIFPAMADTDTDRVVEQLAEVLRR